VARVLPALLLLLVPIAYAQTPDALAALDDCASRLDAGLDVGYERIAARCPTLTRTLEHSPWAAWLPADWKEPHNQLNAEGLRTLHKTLARENAATPGTRLLHPERVGAVLERVARPDGAEEGWWPRFKRWLRELLAPAPHEERGWWRRLFGEGSIDRSVLRAVAVVSIALLVIMALMVVTNELRVAGLLRRRPGSARGLARSVDGRLSSPNLDAAEPSAQPALLLELIAARLAAQQRLPPARALTVRELIARARLHDEAERAQLAALAAVSERLRYAAGGVTRPALEAALNGGRQLLAALEAPAAAGAA
jgi:hypothetical protein